MKKGFNPFIGLFLAALMVTSIATGVIGCGESETGETVLTITKGTETRSYTLAEIMDMPAEEGWGGRMRSTGDIEGPYRERGVTLLDLLEDVGGISEGDAIRAIAPDGYSMTYSYDQITNGNFTTLECTTGEEVTHGQLTVIISYEEDGEPLYEGSGPLRVGILTESTHVTEGHWWVKNVVTIEVVAGEQSWSLYLEGVITEDMDSDTFESGATPGCHGASWTDGDGHVWEGIPLWLLVGRVDDDNPHSHETQAFNDTVADVGYEVQVIAADGYSKTFTSEEVRRNDDMIIAFRYDDEPLGEDEWPLRLVGPALTGGQMVSQITEIRVVFP